MHAFEEVQTNQELSGFPEMIYLQNKKK